MVLRFGDADKPWFRAINGTFCVAAGVMSPALSMEFDFLAVGELAAFVQAIAWLCLRPAGPPAHAFGSSAARSK
jgi:hypothetical protein